MAFTRLRRAATEYMLIIAVVVLVDVATGVDPLVTGTFIGDGVDVYASSAAQAYGGFIEDFAEKETDELDLAEGWVDEDEYDAFYRAAIVPGWAVGMDEE